MFHVRQLPIQAKTGWKMESYQKPKPVEVSEEWRQGNRESHMAGPSDREGRGSLKCPIGMTPFISKIRI